VPSRSSSLSPARKASARVHPFSCTQNGWSGVVVTVLSPTRTWIKRDAGFFEVRSTLRYDTSPVPASLLSTRSPARTRSMGTAPSAVQTNVPATKQGGWGTGGGLGGLRRLMASAMCRATQTAQPAMQASVIRTRQSESLAISAMHVPQHRLGSTAFLQPS